MKISFYRPNRENGWLSNFSEHGFELDGKYWPTVEHYFQAAKFFETAPEYAELIRLAPSPAKAKKLGCSQDVSLRPDWQAVRIEVMRRAITHKFEAHRDLRKALIATGSAELVEDSRVDGFWGAGATGTGTNMAGVILMEVRELLKKKQKEKNGV